MFGFYMFDLTILQLIVLLGCAILVGFSKTAGTSFSSIIIPLMVDVFPVREATGILCLAFFIASFHAVYHYRRYVKWNYMGALTPGALIGIGLGAYFMQNATNDAIRLFIGLIILAMLGLNFCNKAILQALNSGKASLLFSTICGVLIGFTSIVANAGSPILALYLLLKGENKFYVIGTLSVFFLFVDLVKIPINILTAVVTLESLKLNILMLPLMLLGGFIGIAFLRWISSNSFKRIVETMSFIGAIKLIYRPLVNLI